MTAAYWWIIFLGALVGIAFARAQIHLSRARKLLHEAREMHDAAAREFQKWQQAREREEGLADDERALLRTVVEEVTTGKGELSEFTCNRIDRWLEGDEARRVAR